MRKKKKLIFLVAVSLSTLALIFFVTPVIIDACTYYTCYDVGDCTGTGDDCWEQGAGPTWHLPCVWRCYCVAHGGYKWLECGEPL